ncbi:OadG family protein [Methylotuvimicrobium alcaliphilum]|uniref:Probable oxaloacetate decarboxylase gamma chain n=1 Tax=Methylotuvimicrobium alcaliphilum (strain DSM 19304 / NCIMB 14124 / VKM B-2133 / 20Z) TaxID=1091494 RepID=G4SY37_META2|nr:OadG family protein [Methylotuvimicrobium alcaliphilum]CCE24338.1 Sodium pump decarboxylase, gamma subunit [Methylotuvimicrobium alcaliphilum 20Z]
MTEILIRGGELMAIGMGIVFLFLVMLIFAVNSMSTLIARFIDGPTINADNTKPAPAPSQGDIDPSLIAAISSAVHQYRNKGPQSTLS